MQPILEFKYLVSLRKLPPFSIAVHNGIRQANFFGSHAKIIYPTDALARFSPPKIEVRL